MGRVIRLFLIFEAASFAVAAMIHSGGLIKGYEHPQARIAEGVIAAVLLMGLLLTWIQPSWLRKVGLTVQGFALLGTLVGVFTIIIGVGPQTAPDVVYHIAILLVLAWGLSVAARSHLAT
jgi:hypothetical protein